MEKFTLDKKLDQDSIFIKDLKISKLLLINDSNYPWFILVPKKLNISEIFELTEEEQFKLSKEINYLAKFIKEKWQADKMNIANLGNVVTQLHIHIIARYKNDISFPKPIWGVVKTKKYSEKEIEKIRRKLDDFDL